jgi:hypothetical protein
MKLQRFSRILFAGLPDFLAHSLLARSSPNGFYFDGTKRIPAAPLS